MNVIPFYIYEFIDGTNTPRMQNKPSSITVLFDPLVIEGADHDGTTIQFRRRQLKILDLAAYLKHGPRPHPLFESVLVKPPITPENVVWTLPVPAWFGLPHEIQLTDFKSYHSRPIPECYHPPHPNPEFERSIALLPDLLKIIEYYFDVTHGQVSHEVRTSNELTDSFELYNTETLPMGIEKVTETLKQLTHPINTWVLLELLTQKRSIKNAINYLCQLALSPAIQPPPQSIEPAMQTQTQSIDTASAPASAKSIRLRPLSVSVPELVAPKIKRFI